MYNTEEYYFTENELPFAEVAEFDIDFGELTEAELFGYEDSFAEDDFVSDNGIFDDDEIIEEAFFDDEALPADINYPGDDISLLKLVGEINHETSSMNESETMDYMEDRMAEFLPALAAAIPTIIQLAPKAISAISSLIKKDSPKQKAAPVAAPAAPVTTINNLPQIVTDNKNPNDQGAAGISSIPALRVFTDLIQSPKFLELLSGLLAGKKQNINAKTGQKVNASNLLGIVASLAGALAGEAGKGSQESFFPEYAMSDEGSFLIDPHNAQQEAELILDLIN